MIPHERGRARIVIGPDGSPLSFANLPPSDTVRWVVRRKAIVVAAVDGGLLSMEEACARYTLSIEEYLSWREAVHRHGLAGLRTTKVQKYRGAAAAPHTALSGTTPNPEPAN